MAQFIDEREEEIELEEGEELESFEESEEQSEDQPDNAFVEDEPEDDIPDKYRNKAPKDIIAMHQNAEKLLGKQSQEVGELRKVVDDFIQAQTVKQQEQSPASTDEDDDLDFFENPKSAVQKMLDNHPSVKQAQDMAANIKKQETVAMLKANFPNYSNIISDPAFGEWVGKSKVRSALLQQADKQYNYDAAEELFSLWQDRQGMVEQAVKSEKTARKAAVKTASTGSAKGSGERSSRKIYRRADIIELMQKDPNRYAALAEEIRQAYADGRVK